MIAPRKLLRLPYGTRMRKLERLLAGVEAREDTETDRLALHHLIAAVAGHRETPEFLVSDLRRLSRDILHAADETVRRQAGSIRHALRKELGIATGEWDLVAPADRSESRVVLPHRLFLEDLRSPFNVGSIFRTAESFGIGEIIVSPHCAPPDHPRARRSAMGTDAMVPWRVAELADVVSPPGGPVHGETVFLLETGGTPIDRFPFPERGLLLVGSEELGAGSDARAAASGGVVSIDTGGRKASLNVGVAVGITLHYWYKAAPR